MTKLHKPERATYSQAVEADYDEFWFVSCNWWGDYCWGDGPTPCCY